MSQLSIIIWGFTILLFIIILEIGRNKKIINLEHQIKELLSITASLKLRVFDHEKYLLDKDGVYIPDEIAVYYFNQTWAIIDAVTKEKINKEYEDMCPSTIPLWKYFLYCYKPEIQIKRKIKLKKIDSVEELMNLTSKNIDDLTKQFSELKRKSEEYSKSVDDFEKNPNQ